MDEMTLGVPSCYWASHTAPSGSEAAELFLTLVSELQGLFKDDQIEL